MEFIRAAGVRLLVGGALMLAVAGAVAEQPGGDVPTAAAIQRHWLEVIGERDPARRQTLIDEHRRMMAAAQRSVDDKSTAAAGEKRRRGASEGIGQPGLSHTLEMHAIMLDMMK